MAVGPTAEIGDFGAKKAVEGFARTALHYGVAVKLSGINVLDEEGGGTRRGLGLVGDGCRLASRAQ